MVITLDKPLAKILYRRLYAQSNSTLCLWTCREGAVVVLVGCLTSQQHASVSQGRICKDNFTCCHSEIEVADQTFHLTQSQYTDTGPTSPSADPITPGAWQGRHWSANFLVTGMTRPRKKSLRKRGFEPGIFRSRGGRLTIRPTSRSKGQDRRSVSAHRPVGMGRSVTVDKLLCDLLFYHPPNQPSPIHACLR